MAREANRRPERILVLAPVGKDGALACQILGQAGLAAEVCATMDDLCRQFGAGAGALLVTQEVLDPVSTHRLVEALGQQPSWSDIPLVVVTCGSGTQFRLRGLRTLEPLGNVTFLERPIRVMTLVSTIRMTLRARCRQYEMRDLLGRLEQEMRQRDEFLAMLGHELRNPLAPIRNAVELLRMQDPLDGQDVAWAAELVDRQTQQLTRMVDDLLEVSRLTRGKISLRPEPVDLATVVSRAVETSRPLLDARHHRLNVALPDPPLWVRADVARLAQVVTNLLNNAAKYTEEGGHIWLELRREGEAAMLTVRDTGIGISADLLPHVFDPFTQGERSPDRSQAGLGLGLAVVHKLMELHGGSVCALSAGPGHGSEFVVSLPLLAGVGYPHTPSADGQGGPVPTQQRRILIVEDNRDAADSLATVLKLTGHEVCVTYEGKGALEVTRTFWPDVILLDIGLPGMDGYEVARRLRSEPGQENVLLVAMTGYGQEQDRRRSQEAGFDAHCVKPVDLQTLQLVLARPTGGVPAPRE